MRPCNKQDCINVCGDKHAVNNEALGTPLKVRTLTLILNSVSVIAKNPIKKDLLCPLRLDYFPYLITLKVMSIYYYNDIPYIRELYKIAHVSQEGEDGTLDSGTAIADSIQTEYWWEEVDRVYPLYDMNDSSPTRDPSRESEVLERFGQVEDDIPRSDPAFSSQDQEQDRGRSRAKRDTNKKKKDKEAAEKKRRRSESQKKDNKKQKNDPKQGAGSQAGGNNTNARQSSSQQNRKNNQGGRNGRAKQAQSEPRQQPQSDQPDREQTLRDLRQRHREALRGSPRPEQPPKPPPGRTSTSASNRRPLSGVPTPIRGQTPSMPRPGPSSPGTLLRPPLLNIISNAARDAYDAPIREENPGTSQERGSPGPQGPPLREDTDVIEEVTAQGLDREAHRRLLEANNPVSTPVPAKKAKIKIPDDHTYEITYPDMTPIHDDFMIAAEMLGEAQWRADKEKNANRTRGEPKIRLKIDSRKLRCGDWIVLAEDAYTKEWLAGFFNTAEFRSKFVATLVSERNDNFKYTLKIQPPASKRSNEEIMDHIFEDFDDIGYVRIMNDTRFYRDRDNSGNTNKAYHKAMKKGTEFDDHGVPYIKTIWIRMNESANVNFERNFDDLNLHLCGSKIEIEKAKEKKKKSQGSQSADQNKTSDGDGEQNVGKDANGTGNGNGNGDGNPEQGTAGEDDQIMDDSEEELVGVVLQSGEEGDDIEPVGPTANNGGE